MTKEIITQLKSRRAELMTELSRIERAIVALDAAPAQTSGKKPGRPKGAKPKSNLAKPSDEPANGHMSQAGVVGLTVT